MPALRLVATQRKTPRPWNSPMFRVGFSRSGLWAHLYRLHSGLIVPHEIKPSMRRRQLQPSDGGGSEYRHGAGFAAATRPHVFGRT